MRVRKNNYKKPCGCGCGKQIWHLGAQGKPIRFSLGHQGKGENNYRWKGGEHITTQGYRAVYRPDYPFINKNRPYVLEHRVVWEEFHKACLLSWANVHHINEVKTDNRPENLIAMMIGHHTTMHFLDPTKNQWLCSICGQKTYLRKNGREEWYRNPEDKQKHRCRKCYRRWCWKNRGRS